MKMLWFFTATSEIPWPFKLCGMFQACCDSYLGIQYWMYGEGPTLAPNLLGHSHPPHDAKDYALHSQGINLAPTIARARTPSNAMRIPMTMSEKEERLD